MLYLGASSEARARADTEMVSANQGLYFQSPYANTISVPSACYYLSDILDH